MKTLRIIVPLAALALAACSKPDTAPGPGGVTVGEAKALDEAAAMLDERRPPAQAIQPSVQPAPVSAGTPAP